jgi:hypothetical protein
MLHLYCIVPRAHPVPDGCAGMEGRAPLVVEAAGLALWATEHERPVAASVEAARVHNGVITAAMDARVTPVPLRFGQTVPDRAAAADHMSEAAARWLTLLDRFAGRAEYGTRVLVDDPDAEQDVHAAKAASGTEYMASLARKQARVAGREDLAGRLAERIARAVGTLATDVRIETPPAGGVLVSIAHLVAWTTADAYHEAMREVREASQDTRFLLTGPWPPYSFVE